MLIINADFPAGMTIEQAIRDALEFSQNNRCMVRCDINDVEITVVAGIMPTETAVKYYLKLFRGGMDNLAKKVLTFPKEDAENDGKGKT